MKRLKQRSRSADLGIQLGSPIAGGGAGRDRPESRSAASDRPAAGRRRRAALKDE